MKLKRTIQPANQQAIANKAYGGRGGNGPAATGYGWRYRGRGIFQLTLRNNYSQFNSEYPEYWSNEGIDFVAEPDKVVDFPYFIRSAVWYWVKNRIYKKADEGTSDSTIDAITEMANGPAKHAAEKRRENFANLTYPAFK